VASSIVDRIPPSPDSAVSPLIEPLLAKRQVAELLGISVRSVERLIAGGALPAVRIGATCRIDPKDVRRLIDAAKDASP
jgi:excisionase family DNA binding protein